MSVVVVQSDKKFADIPVGAIKSNSDALREVDRKNPEYLEMADSVRKDGVLLPIRVRAMQDTETGETYYGLIDGLQRLTASKDAGFETVPAYIVARTDEEVDFDQIITNVVKVETKPVEYSKKLQRLLEMNPTMTCANLAARLSKSDTWLKERLKLTQLSTACAKLVDEGVINIANAYALAKLPADEQDLLIQQAQTLPTGEFVPMATQRKKDIEKAKREGNAGRVPEFAPRQALRKLTDVQGEAETSSAGKAYVASQRLTTAEDGWDLAILWVMQADPDSIATQRKKFNELQAAENDKREKAQAERERRRTAALAVKSARAKMELDMVEAHSSPEEIVTALAAFDEAHKAKKSETASE